MMMRDNGLPLGDGCDVVLSVAIILERSVRTKGNSQEIKCQ